MDAIVCFCPGCSSRSSCLHTFAGTRCLFRLRGLRLARHTGPCREVGCVSLARRDVLNSKGGVARSLGPPPTGLTVSSRSYWARTTLLKALLRSKPGRETLHGWVAMFWGAAEIPYPRHLQPCPVKAEHRGWTPRSECRSADRSHDSLGSTREIPASCLRNLVTTR